MVADQRASCSIWERPPRGRAGKLKLLWISQLDWSARPATEFYLYSQVTGISISLDSSPAVARSRTVFLVTPGPSPEPGIQVIQTTRTALPEVSGNVTVRPGEPDSIANCNGWPSGPRTRQVRCGIGPAAQPTRQLRARRARSDARPPTGMMTGCVAESPNSILSVVCRHCGWAVFATTPPAQRIAIRPAARIGGRWFKLTSI